MNKHTKTLQAFRELSAEDQLAEIRSAVGAADVLFPRKPPRRAAVLLTLLEAPCHPMALTGGGAAPSSRTQSSPDPSAPDLSAPDLSAPAPSSRGLHLLFEQRALSLAHQPGEVCFPGGALEPGEAPEEAALREACEELLVTPEDISLLGSLGVMPGPGNSEVHLFAGLLKNYTGTSSPDEVEQVFTIPVDWFLQNPPAIYRGCTVTQPEAAFPVDLIPGGKEYRWGSVVRDIPVYHGTDPLLWGFTARVLLRFLELLKHRYTPQE